MSDKTCPMCGAAVTAAARCRSCSEDLPTPVGNRRAQMPMLPSIVVLAIPFIAIVVALLLPLVAWLRHLLNGH